MLRTSKKSISSFLSSSFVFSLHSNGSILTRGFTKLTSTHGLIPGFNVISIGIFLIDLKSSFALSCKTLASLVCYQMKHYMCQSLCLILFIDYLINLGMVLAEILDKLFGFQIGVLGKCTASCYQGREYVSKAHLIGLYG